MKRILLCLTLLLAACGSTVTEPTVTPVDVNAVQTSVVQTIVADATRTAEALPSNTPEPTLAPIETFTPEPTVPPTPAGTPTLSTCDDAAFVADVSVPDGTQLTPGQEFIKTWKVRNTGSCTWTTGYVLVWSYGDNRMNGQSTALPNDVPPGTEVDISINLQAPTTPGTYNGYWILRNNNGFTFGQRLSVIIVVP